MRLPKYSLNDDPEALELSWSRPEPIGMCLFGIAAEMTKGKGHVSKTSTVHSLIREPTFTRRLMRGVEQCVAGYNG
jgi:hypothetical protein